MSFNPRAIGRYEVLGLLGAGGMAQVLLGRLRDAGDFQRVVALKVLLPATLDIDGSSDMLLDEAKLAASIHHPNVAQVHELLFAEHCIVMEYLAGESVSRLLFALRLRGELLPPALACHIVAESCAGLHAAHEHKDPQGRPSGLVHRDVSPQNLFVTYDGAVKVLDFGVARAAGRRTHTQVGTIKGKAHYMSPEQSEGRELDRRSDVFSMGIVLWEMLTGRSLFRSGTASVAQTLTTDPIVPPGRVVAGLNAALDAASMKALAARPEDRFADAAQLRRELLKAAQSLPLEGPADDALAKLMHELFEKERTDKEALARNSGAGPPQPTAKEPGTTVVDGKPRRARVTPLLAVALVLALAGGAVLLWPVADVKVAEVPVVALPAATSLHEATAALEPSPAPTTAPNPEPAAAAPAPKTVKVQIDTVPRGAEVRVGQRVVGRSPVEVELGWSSEPLRVTVRHPGSESLEQQVVPDRDQRLLLQLHAARARRPGQKDVLDEKW